MSGSDALRPVSKARPCEICGKPDWCRRSTSGAHECHRIDEAASNGYVRVTTTPAGFAVYRLPQDEQAGKDRKRPIIKADLAAEDRKFQIALSSERKTTIAGQLCVTVAALDSIGMGRASTDDLKRLRASGAGWREGYPLVVSSFPECDARGAIVGFCFRADDGRKGAPSGKLGAKRGLIIPSTLPARPDPVLVVEGPTDVAACETLHMAAVGRPSNAAGSPMIAALLARRAVLVVGENDRNPAGTWPGKEGAEKLAATLASKWKRTVRWTLPPERYKDVRACLLNLIANGLDIDDERACREAGQRLLSELDAAAKEQGGPTASQSPSADDRGARETLLRLCMEACDHFFHDNENAAYVLVRERGIARTLLVRSRDYALLLGRRYYRATGSGLPTAAKSEAVATLEGLAVYDGPEEPVFVRIGEFDGNVVLDLCDDQWRVVVASKSGWEVRSESPIRFRRTRGMLPLPPPVRGGSIADLRPFLNVRTENDFVLVCGFLIVCFNPHGPFMVLLLNGEPGSAKSTLCRVVRSLVDPNKAPLKCEPKDNRDLAIAASNAWVFGLDNMSHISERISNALCRLATGGGFSTRELYTDGDEAIFDAKRPVMINGIGEVAERSDLIDRSVRLTLPTIPEDRRRTEGQIWAEFERAQPRLLGALLDSVSAALRNRDTVRFARLPRMADSAAWVVAAEPACPWVTGSFIAALDNQRQEADEFVVEVSPLAGAVRDWVDRHGPIKGTATQILERLSAGRDDKFLKHPGWPKGAPALGTKLREVAPNLRRLGIQIEFERHGARRVITIARIAKTPETPSSLSQAPTEPGPTGQNDDRGGPTCDSDPPPDDSDRLSGDSEALALGGPERGS